MTLEELKSEIDNIYFNNPEKRDKYVFIYTIEGSVYSEYIYHIDSLDNIISDRIYINMMPED